MLSGFAYFLSIVQWVAAVPTCPQDLLYLIISSHGGSSSCIGTPSPLGSRKIPRASFKMANCFLLLMAWPCGRTLYICMTLASELVRDSIQHPNLPYVPLVPSIFWVKYLQWQNIFHHCLGQLYRPVLFLAMLSLGSFLNHLINRFILGYLYHNSSILKVWEPSEDYSRCYGYSSQLCTRGPGRHI